MHFRNRDMKFSKEAVLVSLLGFFALPWKRLTLHMFARLAFSSQNFQHRHAESEVDGAHSKQLIARLKLKQGRFSPLVSGLIGVLLITTK